MRVPMPRLAWHGSLFVVGVFCVLVTSARAECVAGGRWWLDQPSIQFVFSATVERLEPTADGRLATVRVHRTWKGTLPRKLELYMSNAPSLELRHRYVLAASWMPRPGFRTLDSVIGTVQCGALDYEGAERTGMLASLGSGREPRR